MRILIPALLVALAALPSEANADIQRLAGFGGIEMEASSMGGTLGQQFSSDEQTLFYFAGLKLNDFDLRFMVGGSEITPTDAMQHGTSLSSIELGTSLRYVFAKPTPHTNLYVRGGLNRVWWSSSETLRKTCGQTGDCVAGFKQEEPHFQGIANRVGVGAEWTPLRRSAWTYFTFSADLGYEVSRMKVWKDNEYGHTITASLNMAIGGGKNGYGQ